MPDRHDPSLRHLPHRVIRTPYGEIGVCIANSHRVDMFSVEDGLEMHGIRVRGHVTLGHCDDAWRLTRSWSDAEEDVLRARFVDVCLRALRVTVAHTPSDLAAPAPEACHEADYLGTRLSELQDERRFYERCLQHLMTATISDTTAYTVVGYAVEPEA